MNLDHLDETELLELLELQQELKKRESRRYIATQFLETGSFPRSKYKKHMLFFQAGSEYKLRLFMAANRVGKTHAACYELALHLTGEYPDWWEGKRFTKANAWWCCGENSKLIISTLQVFLLGPIGDFGTGMIPYDNLDHETLKDAKKADTPISIFRVRHKDGGFSSVEFKSYESGRESFQGTARSILMDEEPPVSVFTECLLRTATDDNIMILTFTPLKGISETILSFLEGSQFCEGPVGKGKHVTMAAWDDVPHLSDIDKEILLASIPPFQRDARTKGIPSLGAGAIYPVPESEFVIQPFEIPEHYKKVYGMDVGWNRTAVVWAAIDPETKTMYIYSEHYKGEAEASIHAQSIKARGDWIPGVIDTAARGRSQTDGQSLMELYKDLGLKLNDADKAVETGLYITWELLSGGQIKVFNTCTNFLSEFRMYRRDEKGKVVKTNDHLMDAFRYLVMSGRDIAKTKQATLPRRVNNSHSEKAW